MDDYHRTRRSGPASPTKLYEKKCADMQHQPRIYSIKELTLALGTVSKRYIKQGSITIDAERYTCPKLYEAVGDEQVQVIIPPPEISAPLMIFDGEVFELDRDNAFAPRDHAGFQESAARKNAYNGAAYRRFLELGGRYAHPADHVRLASHWLPKLRKIAHPVFAEQDPHHDDSIAGRQQDRRAWSEWLVEQRR